MRTDSKYCFQVFKTWTNSFQTDDRRPDDTKQSLGGHSVEPGRIKDQDGWIGLLFVAIGTKFFSLNIRLRSFQVETWTGLSLIAFSSPKSFAKSYLHSPTWQMRLWPWVVPSAIHWPCTPSPPRSPSSRWSDHAASVGALAVSSPFAGRSWWAATIAKTIWLPSWSWSATSVHITTKLKKKR